jgi:hypothetical protein
MADPNAVAITSIVVAGVATISAPLLAARTQARREQRRVLVEKELRDLDELRELLDAASACLHDLDDAAHKVQDVLHERPQGPPTRLYDAYWAQHWTAIRMRSRLAIRVGSESLVAQSYAQAVEASRDAFVWLLSRETMQELERGDDLGDQLSLRADDFLEHDQRFKGAIDTFLDAAKQCVHSTG